MTQFNRKRFMKALEMAQDSMHRGRGTIPILYDAHLVSDGEAMVMETTDLNNSMTIELPVEWCGQAFECTLPSPKRVRASLAALDAEIVCLDVDEEEEAITVASGRMSFKFIGKKPHDFPAMARIAAPAFSADLGAQELNQIARVIGACSQEETRYYLKGICVRKVSDWNYQFAATDGHRLYVVEIPLPNATGRIPDGTIIPYEWLKIALSRFPKAKEGAKLSYGPVVARNDPEPTLAPNNPLAARIALSGDFDGFSATLTGKLIDGTYPDYTRVIPQGQTHMIRVKRVELMLAIAALSPMSDSKKVRAVKLTTSPGLLKISLKSVDLGEGSIDLPVEHNLDGRGYQFGVNGNYLRHALAMMRGDEVEMYVDPTSAVAPILLKSPTDTTFSITLMPMRF